MMTAHFSVAASDLLVLRSRTVRPSRIAAVVAAVAEASDLTPADLIGRERGREVSHPRQVAMALCLELPHATLPQIARAFGRDHTTIIHAREAVRRRMSPDLQAAMDRIRERAGVTP